MCRISNLTRLFPHRQYLVFMLSQPVVEFLVHLGIHGFQVDVLSRAEDQALQKEVAECRQILVLNNALEELVNLPQLLLYVISLFFLAFFRIAHVGTLRIRTNLSMPMTKLVNAAFRISLAFL